MGTEMRNHQGIYGNKSNFYLESSFISFRPFIPKLHLRAKKKNEFHPQLL